MVKRVLHALKLDKIAAVDRPCQEGAVSTIIKSAPLEGDALIDAYMKREFSDDKRKELAASGAALPDGSFPIENGGDLENAIRAIGRAKDPAKAKSHIRSRAKSLGMTDKLPEDWTSKALILKGMRGEISKVSPAPGTDGDAAKSFDDLINVIHMTDEMWDAWYTATDALRSAICSIVEDTDAKDKPGLIEESVQQFADYIKESIPGEIGKSLAEGFSAAIAGSARQQGETMTTEAVKKALGLKSDASEADVLKAITEQADKVAKAEAFAKMSDAHQAFASKGGKMPSGGKDAFAAMSADERDAHIKSNPVKSDDDEDDAKKRLEKALADGDAFKTADGVVIVKSVVGEAAFGFMKSTNEKLIKQGEELAAAKEAHAIESFKKRAVDAGLPEDLGPTLRKAYSGDAAAQAEIEKRMLALKKQVDEGALFDNIGSSVAKAGSAYAELDAKADALQKADPKTYPTKAQAFAKVYEQAENAPIVKRYKEEMGRPA